MLTQLHACCWAAALPSAGATAPPYISLMPHKSLMDVGKAVIKGIWTHAKNY